MLNFTGVGLGINRGGGFLLTLEVFSGGNSGGSAFSGGNNGLFDVVSAAVASGEEAGDFSTKIGFCDDGAVWGEDFYWQKAGGGHHADEDEGEIGQEGFGGIFVIDATFEAGEFGVFGDEFLGGGAGGDGDARFAGEALFKYVTAFEWGAVN